MHAQQAPADTIRHRGRHPAAATHRLQLLPRDARQPLARRREMPLVSQPERMWTVAALVALLGCVAWALGVAPVAELLEGLLTLASVPGP